MSHANCLSVKPTPEPTLEPEKESPSPPKPDSFPSGLDDISEDTYESVADKKDIYDSVFSNLAGHNVNVESPSDTPRMTGPDPIEGAGMLESLGVFVCLVLICGGLLYSMFGPSPQDKTPKRKRRQKKKKKSTST